MPHLVVQCMESKTKLLCVMLLLNLLQQLMESDYIHEDEQLCSVWFVFGAFVGRFFRCSSGPQSVQHAILINEFIYQLPGFLEDIGKYL